MAGARRGRGIGEIRRALERKGSEQEGGGGVGEGTCFQSFLKHAESCAQYHVYKWECCNKIVVVVVVAIG